MKRCQQCKRLKDEKQFEPSRLAPDGLVKYCADCLRKSQPKAARRKRESLRKLCDCGNPASIRLNNEWICPRCRELEKRFYAYQREENARKEEWSEMSSDPAPDLL